MSQGWPKRCTGMIARVRGDTRRRMLSGSMPKVTGSTSAMTGTPPSSATASAVAA